MDRTELYRDALRDIAIQLPLGLKRLRLRRLAKHGTAEEVESLALKIESIFAEQGEPQLVLGDGTALVYLEKLIQLIIKYLPLILALL